MILDESFFIHLMIFYEIYFASYLLLPPKEGYTSSDTDMYVQLIMTFYYFLSLNKIRRMSLLVYPPTIKPCSRHKNAPTTDIQVTPRKVLCLDFDLSHKTLDNWNCPTRMNLIDKKRFQQVLIPSILIKRNIFLLKDCICQLLSIAKVKEVSDIIFLQHFNNFFLFFDVLLFLVFFIAIWQKHEIRNHEDRMFNILSYLFCIDNQKKIRLLINDYSTKKQVKFNNMT